jgi:16S rRNA (cytidine1402-2'-O)-methyltransferase
MNQPLTFSLMASVSKLADELDAQQFPPSALYVIATPIGNVSDISLRALKVLAMVDAIACEDTRNTSQLLTRYGISKKCFAAHQHNERSVAEKIVQQLQEGSRIALVSDAGTPGISDPGAHIVDAVLEAGLQVIPLPGASAAITALSCSGLLSDDFYFVGFLPNKNKQRETELAKLSNIKATLVFYEAPHRILETMASLIAIFGSARRILIAREISKLFEQIHRCSLGSAIEWFKQDENRQRGEFVLLIEGAASTNSDEDSEAERILRILLDECSVSQAATLAARITGKKKNALYELALAIQQKSEADGNED